MDEFKTTYMTLLTTQCHNDLDLLRRDPKFKDSEVQMLIDTLSAGGDVFEESEKVVLLDSLRGLGKVA